jgi:CheY-like chemotaxis protein
MPPEKPESVAAKAGSGRVLVVEDDPGVREMFLYALGRHGWDAQGAADGLQAWRCLQEREFAVVVTDLQMPSMDGLALLKRVRRMENPPPVVIQTTLLNSGLEGLLRKAGAFQVLVKGGPLNRFLRSVEEAAAASPSHPAHC